MTDLVGQAEVALHAYRQVAMGVGCHFSRICMFGLGVRVADREIVEMEANGGRVGSCQDAPHRGVWRNRGRVCT